METTRRSGLFLNMDAYSSESYLLVILETYFLIDATFEGIHIYYSVQL